MTKYMPNCNGFVCEKAAPHCVCVRFWVWTFAALFFDCYRSSLMRAVNVRVTSKHPFLSQSDRIGDKLSVSLTRSLFIRRRLFVSEQDTDTVSTFPPVYSRRANRWWFCWVIENYSVTLFNGHKNSIFLGCWCNSCYMGRAAQVRLMPSMFILIDCFLTILLYCGKVLHRTAQLLLTVLLFIFSSFHIYFNYFQIILVPFCMLSYLSSRQSFFLFFYLLRLCLFPPLLPFFCPPRRKSQMLHMWCLIYVS